MSSLLLPGDAGFADVLAGKKFSAGSKFNAQGTMPNNGAVTLTPSGNGTVVIPAGYHNGAGVVAQVNVPAANVLTGTTIAGVSGTMPNQGSPSWTPGPSNILLPAGYYTGGTIQGDANLAASNIRGGVSIFGVAGNALGSYNASGSVPVSSIATVTISGLSFNPTSVFLQFWDSASSRYFYAQKVTTWAAQTFTLNWTSDISAGSTLDGQSASITFGTGSFSFSIPDSNYVGYSVTWLAVA